MPEEAPGRAGGEGESGVVGEGGDEFCRIHTLEALIGDERRWELASALGRGEDGGALGALGKGGWFLPASGRGGGSCYQRASSGRRKGSQEWSRGEPRREHNITQAKADVAPGGTSMPCQLLPRDQANQF